MESKMKKVFILISLTLLKVISIQALAPETTPTSTKPISAERQIKSIIMTMGNLALNFKKFKENQLPKVNDIEDFKTEMSKLIDKQLNVITQQLSIIHDLGLNGELKETLNKLKRH
jgi:hypothetical protein